ncbi:MAG: MerR family transcriptional regulator, partial [Chitinophagaceae bacterium]
MKMYHIAELEKLSGVKAATIRMWEKRYGFITPERTDTNIRRYDDHQVRKLLNIVTLLSGGYKLAKIAQLSEADVRAIVSGLHRASQKSDAFSGSLVNDLIMAMLTFDRVGFEKAYDSSVQKYG